MIQRDEKDLVSIQSGTEFGITLGTPIGLLVPNQDQRPRDYSETDLYPRPSHADWTYLQKYGVKASSGGGRASARETIGIGHCHFRFDTVPIPIWCSIIKWVDLVSYLK